jgi:hypothetical protein
VRAALVLFLAILATVVLLSLRDDGPEPRSSSSVVVPEPPAHPAVEETPVQPEPFVGSGAAGRVLDEEWRPIAGAVVECDGANATTNSDGRFTLPPATRRAKVRAEGYVTGGAYWRYPTEDVEVILVRGGALVGTVRDEEGAPVPGAGVRSGKVETTADDQGRYRLADLPTGFLAEMDARTPGRAWQALVPLPEAPVREGKATPFDPVARKGVHVAGTAPPGATVVLEKDRARTTADAEGRFRFDGVVPGRYGIRLDPGVYRTIHVGSRGLDGIVLADPPRATLEVPDAGAPGTLVIGGTRRDTDPGPDGTLRFVDVLATSYARLTVGDFTVRKLALPAGKTTVFRIPPPDFVFAGVVEDPDGCGVAGAHVRALSEAAEFEALGLHDEAFTDANGRFRIEVRSSARSFALIVSHPACAPSVLRRLDASSDALRIRLAYGASIEGTVRYDTGEPVPRAFVSVLTRDPRWSRLGSDDRILADVLDAAPYREWRGTRADARGRFRIEGLVPGTYWVGYDPSVKASTGGEPVHLVIERDTGSSIAGIVVDPRGARVPNAIVRAGECGARTDGAGRFRIEGLTEGAHDLVATPQELDFMGGPCFEATTLRGVEAGRDDVVVRVGDGRIVRGRIVDKHGVAVAGAEVVRLPPPPPEHVRVGSRPHTPEARTDADGRYELRGLDEGPVELAVFRNGFLPVVFTVTGDDAGPRRLARGASISGVLLDADGVPAPRRMLRCSLENAANPADLAPWRRNWQMYGPRFDVRTGAEGRFRLTGLPAGEYEIECGRLLVPVRVTAGTDELELRLLAVLTITGVVVGPDGRPVCRSGGRRLMISAHHASGQVGYVPVADDGSFRFDRVPQGRVRLHVIGWDAFASTEMYVEAGAQDVRLQMKPNPFR